MRLPLQIQEADLEEVLEILCKESENFANDAEKCAYASCNEEIQAMLSEDNLNRFRAITKAICFPLKDFDYEISRLLGSDDPKEELGRLMQSWITLGSSVEAALQIFLAIHLSNYKDSAWGKWDRFSYETVKSQMFEALNSVPEIDLNKKNRDSLKKILKDFLKSKQDTTHLEQMNLQSLISFFKIHVWWKDDYSEELEVIREFRNCVHAFKSRDIGEWERLLDSLKFYCVLLLDLRSMTPDVDDFFQYEMEARAEYESYYNNY